MSRQYYVRTRGRVMGPFNNEQLFDMRDRGQIQAYDEVSVDQRTWKAFDLMFPSGPAGGRSAPPVSQPSPQKGQRRPPPGSNRMLKIVAASVGGLVVVAGIVVAVILIKRSGSDAAGTNNTSVAAVPEGVITFASNHTAEERYRVIRQSVCWIILGKTVRRADGEWFDLPESSGSGFCVSDSGHIVTNNHVVEDYLKYRGSILQRKEEAELNAKIEPKMWVFFGRDDKHEVEEVHASQDYDVAIIRINRKAPYYFAMCETEDDRIAMQDQKVITAGFPSSDRQAQSILFGKTMEKPQLSKPVQRYYQDADFEVTREEGDLKRKPMRGQYSKSQREAGYLNHTARIAKGNSGGPLIAHGGTVMGINTLGVQIEVNGRYITQEGQNYALTMPQLRKEIGMYVPGGGTWRKLPN